MNMNLKDDSVILLLLLLLLLRTLQIYFLLSKNNQLPKILMLYKSPKSVSMEGSRLPEKGKERKGTLFKCIVVLAPER